MTGWYTVLDEHLAVPFQSVVLGVDVTVTGIDLTDDDQIVAVYKARPIDTAHRNPGASPADTAARRRGMDRGVPPLGEKKADRFVRMLLGYDWAAGDGLKPNASHT